MSMRDPRWRKWLLVGMIGFALLLAVGYATLAGTARSFAAEGGDDAGGATANLAVAEADLSEGVTLRATAATPVIEPNYSYYITNRYYGESKRLRRGDSQGDSVHRIWGMCLGAIANNSREVIYIAQESTGYYTMKVTYGGETLYVRSEYRDEDYIQGRGFTHGITTQSVAPDDNTSRWQIYNVTGAYFRIVNVYHNLAAGANGDDIGIKAYDSSNYMQWKFVCTTTLPNMRTVSISGNQMPGSKLTASLSSHLYGASVKYQWRRNGTAISGATSSTYTTTATDAGCTITCAVTDGNGIYKGTAVSAGKVMYNSYYLDLAGLLDGVNSSTLGKCGTCDVYVGGTLVANDVTDFYQKVYQTKTWSISDIKANPGYTYNGVSSGSLSGTMGMSAVTARLKFTANPYTVEFDANGADGAMAPVAATYDKSFTLPDCTFTSYREFEGWNTEPDGTGTAYAPGATVLNLAESGTVKLYAQWGALVELPLAGV